MDRQQLGIEQMKHWLLCAASLIGTPIVGSLQAEESTPLQTEHVALVNHPVIEAARFFADREDVVGELSLRFMNSQSADTGAVVEYFDLPTNSKPRRFVRYFFVRQQINRKGIPDIYLPTVRNFLVRVPANPALRKLIVLNTAKDLAPHALTVDVTTLQEPDSGKLNKPVLKSANRGRNRTWVLVREARISGRWNGSRLSYSVEFEMPIPSGRPRAILFHERAYQDGADPRVWLVVGSSKPDLNTWHRYQVSSRSTNRNRQDVVLMNPQSDAPSDSKLDPSVLTLSR